MRHSLTQFMQAVEQGGNVNDLDREGRTPLFYAAKDGDAAIVAELLKHGANVNLQDNGQKTALHFAANSYQRESAELLLRNGANVDAKDANGNTPLSDAVFDSRGRGEVIKALLSAGADKTVKNNHGVSPEDLAKSVGNYDVSAFLG